MANSFSLTNAANNQKIQITNKSQVNLVEKAVLASSVAIAFTGFVAPASLQISLPCYLAAHAAISYNTRRYLNSHQEDRQVQTDSIAELRQTNIELQHKLVELVQIQSVKTSDRVLTTQITQLQAAKTDILASFDLIHATFKQDFQTLKVELAQFQASQTTILGGFSASIAALEQNTQQLGIELTAHKEQAQNYITTNHLAPLNCKVRQLQREQKAMYLKTIAQFTNDLEQVKQKTDKLSAIASLLPQQSQNKKNSSLQVKKSVSPDITNSVAIFIDGSNLYHAIKSLGIEVDFRKLVNHLKGDAKNCQVYYYTAVDSNDRDQKKFLAYLQYQGYQIVSKELLRRACGNKGNLDVELAVDTIEKADTFSTAILVSGDGDFSYAVEKLKNKGKRVEVASFPDSTSSILTQVADSHHNLAKIKHLIQSDRSHLAS